MSHGDTTRGAWRLPTGEWAGPVALIALLSAGAIVEGLYLTSLRNGDVWGHLRDGMWILSNRSVPQTSIFSQSANWPWRDLSWGYDAIAAITYKTMGLRAAPALAMAYRVVVSAVLFLLAGGRRERPWMAAVFALVGLYVLAGLGGTSTGVSVVLFGIEVLLLLKWQTQPDSRVKYVLPAMFLVWANLDEGFIYGMAVLAIFAGSRLVALLTNKEAAKSEETRLVRDAAIVFVMCFVASGVTPYGYASYPAFWQMETSRANLYIPGYGAMGFRAAVDYVVLLLGMGGFLALGLRRSRDIFLIGLLCGAAAPAFHSRRENWLLIVSSIAVIAATLPDDEEGVGAKAGQILGGRSYAIAAGTVVVVGVAFVALVPRDSTTLLARMAQTLPVKACDSIRNEHLPQPLFNDYEWGGFVRWYLPEYPVAIDARRGLYSEEMETNYFKVMKVDLPYQSLAALNDARTILLRKSDVLAGGLRDVAGFQVVYEDDVAIVLVHGAQE